MPEAEIPYNDDALKYLEKRLENIQEDKQSLEEKSETPSHVEIMEIHEAGNSDTKLEITESLIKAGFGVEGDREQGIDLNLRGDNVHELTDEGIDLSQLDVQEGPQVFYKRIYKEVDDRSILQRASDRINRRTPELKKEETDEVLITVVMNNSNNLGQNTVATAALKHEGGIAKMTAEYGLYHTTTVEEYNNFHETRPSETSEEATQENTSQGYRNNSTLAKLQRGDITVGQYNQQYRKNSGRSLRETWDDYDSKRELDPKYHRSEKRKDEMFAKLSGQYERALEHTLKTEKDILENIEARKKELEDKFYKFWTSKHAEIFYVIETGDQPQLAEYGGEYWEDMKSLFDLKDEQLRFLVDKRRDTLQPSELDLTEEELSILDQQIEQQKNTERNKYVRSILGGGEEEE